VSDDKPALGPSAGEGPEDGEAVRPAAAARPLRPTGKRTRRAAVGVLEDDAEPAEAAASDSASAESDADSEDKAKRTIAAKNMPPRPSKRVRGSTRSPSSGIT